MARGAEYRSGGKLHSRKTKMTRKEATTLVMSKPTDSERRITAAAAGAAMGAPLAAAGKSMKKFKSKAKNVKDKGKSKRSTKGY